MGPALARLLALARPFIMSLATNAIIFLAAGWLLPKLNEIIADIAVKFGVDETTAEDIAGNEFLIFAESVGVTAASLKARIPVRLADKLGFTARGYVKKTIPPDVQRKIALAKGDTAGVAAATAEMTTAAASSIATIRGLSAGTVATVLKYIAGTIGTTSLALLAVAQWIDFGNWNSGAYQGTFNRLYAKFGLVPDQHQASPRVASQEMFDKVYTAMKNEGITTIKHPDTGEVLPFTAPNAALVIDKLASKLFIADGKVTAAALLGLSLALTNYAGAAGAGAGSTTGSVAGSTPQTGGQVATQIKIFTGVISGGTLGAPTEFTPRSDDMIQSEGELRAAAKNNLASFVASLPGRFYYELGIVNTVKTRGGFTQKGAPVRVISSYTSTGKPRYKTIYNKFGQLRLFVSDENNRNIKLATINLGPVNSVDFQPSNDTLQAIADNLTPDLFTSDITEIAEIADAPAGTPVAYTAAPDAPQDAPAPTLTGAPAETPPPGRDNPVPVTIYTPTPGIFRGVGDYGTQIFRALDTGYTVVLNLIDDGSPLFASPAERATFGNAGGQAGEALRRLQSRYGFDWQKLPVVNLGDYFQTLARRGLGYNDVNGSYHAPMQVSFNLQDFITAQPSSLTPSQINDTPTARIVASPAVAAAATLFDYYAAVGQPLPSLPDRAQTYASAGLGAANTYVGTAEQNGRLLAWLKIHSGS